MGSFLRVWTTGLTLSAAALMASCGFPDYGFKDTPTSSTSSSTTSSSSGGGTGGVGGTGGSTGCSSSAECTADPLAPVCDPNTKACVECTPAEDVCAAGTYCTSADKCAVGCGDDADCNLGNPDGGVLTCDLTTHTCQGCSVDDECAPGSICDVPASKCVPGCTPQHDCQVGKACCGATCTDVKTDKDNCGQCGSPCTLAGAIGKCAGGQCAIDTCLPGFQDCDLDPSTGCESAKATDTVNCGSCGNACSGFANAAPACNNGTCDLGACLTGFGNCDGTNPNGCETNLDTSPQNCSGCGSACSLPGAVSGCAAGACLVASCNTGFADCDTLSPNGCEIDIANDPVNCGGCGTVCTLPNASAKCAGGMCAVATCAPPFANCNVMPGDGCEVNTNTSVNNCGSCGTACNLPNATPACSNGACVIAQCAAGFSDCDGNPTNGCEVNTNTSTGNCGGCGQACSTNHGSPTCSAGACTIICTPGFADCNNQVSDGCEVNTATNVNNCNGCGAAFACSAAGGTPACVNSMCTVSSCQPGKGDCDGNVGNGCETTTTNDPMNCGGCGLPCFIANGTAGCAGSQCTVASCNAGFADCDGLASNGCEVNLKTLANCGGCGATCSRANAAATCATGTCQIATCNGTFANCDGNDANGCEVDTAANVNNCGTCGNACSSNNGAPSCSGGSCSIQCAAGFGNCDANVTNGCEAATTNNVNACGGCGSVCAVQNGSPACSGTQCVVASCTAPFKDCDGQYGNGCEINSSNNIANCGTCGKTCSNANGTTACVGGACSPVCAQGFADCDGNPNNGCETDTTASLNHCGGCGMACALANANTQCAAGVCGIASCKSGFADCDLTVGNGCEKPLNTVTDCGACGATCTNANGTTSCAGGTCAPVCSGGFASCDGNLGNGCEAPLNTLTNCGSCGTPCSFPNAIASCSTGTCAFSGCAAGFGNCDGNQANGCETNTNTNNTHCGGCNMPCAGGKICVSGSCVAACPAGTADCNMSAGDGCEINTTNDGDHCGNCATTCSTAQFCSSSACAACAAGQADCDHAGANGCEVTTASDPNNCGSCGFACAGAPNADPTCSASTCGVACMSNFTDCDGNAANGCECGGNICCSGACEPAHINGLGQSFDSCAPLGVPGSAATYTLAMATAARDAWPFAGTDGSTTCTGGVPVVFRRTATSCAVWTYGKSDAGYVHLNTANSTCYCSGGAPDPVWK